MLSWQLLVMWLLPVTRKKATSSYELRHETMRHYMRSRGRRIFTRGPNGKGHGMVGFILTGHGQFSNGLASAIDMVAGDQPAFQIVPFEGSQAATYGDELRQAITAMRAECEGVLVFVDLLGGTPFNQAMMIASDVDNVEVITGTNLPMLIELLLTRGAGSNLSELAEQAVTVGQMGVTHQSVAAMAASADDELDEDGI